MVEILFDAAGHSWTLQTKTSTYCLKLSEDASSLQHVYWGARISNDAAHEMAQIAKDAWAPFESSIGIMRVEYAPWGEMLFNEPSLKVEYADGTRAIEWTFEEHGIEHSGKSHTLWLRFRDRAYPLAVTLYYRIYDGHDVIERWVELENTGSTGPILLEQALSADWQLPHREHYRLTYLHGRWGKETQVAQSELTPGKFVLESRRGITSHQFNPWIALDADGQASQESGEVWSMALAWSGSWQIILETTPYEELHCVGGLNDFDFRYHLHEGAVLKLPTFAGLYSNEGFGAVSREWHSYELEQIVPAPLDSVRPVLYNSWEATSFAVNEQNQMKLVEKAAALGIEVFVMDDGWFGERNNDQAGLGDWTPNREKFPRGLKPLITRVNELGMRFGLWVEPEMVNRDSDLYRAHPDWVYHFSQRSRTESRNQLVLNLARDDVREWMFKTLDKLLSEYHIEFIKWDMNRPLSEPGWPEQTGNNPERVWLDHVRNLYWVIDELRRRHPHVAFESCSGGGGRIDLGMLSRVEQVWTSDNTDAFDRLRIQEGFSYAYAPRLMMCWVTDCPNFITQRTVPLRYRFHVAMAGSLGIGGDLSHWSEQEQEEARHFIETYKQIRRTIQNGLLYRLQSPRNGNITAIQYNAQQGNEVVVFVYGHSQEFGEAWHSVRLRGLEQEAHYTDVETGNTYSGAYLTQKGLTVKLTGDFASQMFHLQSITPS